MHTGGLSEEGCGDHLHAQNLTSRIRRSCMEVLKNPSIREDVEDVLLATDCIDVRAWRVFVILAMWGIGGVLCHLPQPEPLVHRGWCSWST